VSEIGDLIVQRGYWQWVIRPVERIPLRIADYANLEAIVRRCAVRARGWQFPFVGELGEQGLRRFEDHLGFEDRFDHHLVKWAIFQSGQFVALQSHAPDWRDESGWWPLKAGDADPRGYLGVNEVTFRLLEAFEFASRYCQSEAGSPTMYFEVALRHVEKRQLISDAANRAPLFGGYRFDGSELRRSGTWAREDLIANSRALALETASEFFRRFGFEAAPVILRSLQEEWEGHRQG
jgi:hypothetical protein